MKHSPWRKDHERYLRENGKYLYMISPIKLSNQQFRWLLEIVLKGYTIPGKSTCHRYLRSAKDTSFLPPHMQGDTLTKPIDQ